MRLRWFWLAVLAVILVVVAIAALGVWLFGWVMSSL